jgi:tRNA (guanine-N7-)-methyltransferase
VLRAGRTTPAQPRALAELGPRWLLPFEPRVLDFAALFGREAPTVFEIGFGMGEATAAIATAQPERNFIACEVHPPGVGALLARIGALGLGNLRLVRHDAIEVLQFMVPRDSLAGVHVFFPDPWPKKRHHKRRLLRPEVARLLAERLARGGYVHCATDWQAYAEQMLEVLSAEALLANSAEGGGYSPRPAWRPPTKFERRGLARGHGMWDLVFVRR